MAGITNDVTNMKMFTGVGTVYLHRDTVDFRKSINGLSAIVEQSMGLSLFDSALFVFCVNSTSKCITA